MLFNPQPDALILQGDTLIALESKANLDKLMSLLELNSEGANSEIQVRGKRQRLVFSGRFFLVFWNLIFPLKPGISETESRSARESGRGEIMTETYR